MSLGPFSILSKKNQYLLTFLFIVFATSFLGTPQLTIFPARIDQYLPFHTLMETFSIIVSCLAFTMAWENKAEVKYVNTLIVAVAFLAVAIIDFAHVLSFPGMPDFITPTSANKSIFFWLVGRYTVALSMLFLAMSTPHPLLTGNKKSALRSVSFFLYCRLLCGLCLVRFFAPHFY